MVVVVTLPDFSISDIARSGGGPVSGLLLVRHLMTAGHRVIVVAFGASNCFRKVRLREGLVEVHFVRRGLAFPRNPYSGLFRLFAVLKKLDSAADVLHWYSLGSLPAAMLCKRFGIHTPIVATLNGYSLVSPDYSAMHNGQIQYRTSFVSDLASWARLASALKPRTAVRILAMMVSPIAAVLFPLLVSEAGKGAEHYIAIGKDVCELHLAQGYRPITVIPNMVDDSFARVKKTRKKIIAFIGRLVESKGVKTLISAFADFDFDNRFGYSLWIVGDGPLLGSLKRRYASTTAIRFWGHVEQKDMLRLYEDIDIFVHPGIRPEAFGRTVIEAIQTECRVLVSDIGEPKNIVSPFGPTYRFDDPPDLARKLEYMVTHPEIGFVPKTALRQYEPSLITRRVVAVYESVREV